MRRTQIYLGAEELALLDGASQASGASRSELIRRAVRATFGERDKTDKLRALQASAGSWRSRQVSGTAYVDTRRGGDLNDRLSQRGFS